jgi:hypothetical protein
MQTKSAVKIIRGGEIEKWVMGPYRKLKFA